MKTYKITYTIVDGECHYRDHIEVNADKMTVERGTREIADVWVPEDCRDEKKAFIQQLIDEDFAIIPGPGDLRAIEKWYWTEIKPIVVTVRHGMVVDIVDIPGDVTVEVHDFDAENGVPTDPVPFITYWK